MPTEYVAILPMPWSLLRRLPTSQLPTGWSNSAASRRSIASSSYPADEAQEDQSLQLAIEVSYGEPQKPVALTLESHKLRKKRTFLRGGDRAAHVEMCKAILVVARE